MLFVLSAYLLAWVPANFALLASRSLDSLGPRGRIAVVEFSAHALVTLACVVAGWALRTQNAGGRPLSALALVLNAAATIQALHASALPHDIQPGFVAPLTTAAVLNTCAWIAYLYKSTGVRTWLGR